ncbi:MAG: glutamate synthase subunit alpha [Anaerolineae bacterium CG2_30_64_16]|nr:MAG: glutamate synthase subunit alpha [Anaerolineae bacterium CG2_30_64_16]
MYVPDQRLLNGSLYDARREHDACGVGFVADIHGRRSHQILRHALTALANMRHRGACGCEPNTGDGAGVLLQTPHAFLATACAAQDIALPEPGAYGVGMVFLPPDPDQRRACEAILEKTVREAGQQVLGWRTVPTNGASLGATARSREPIVRQLFIGRDQQITDDMAFERKLYVIRRHAERAVRQADLPGGDRCYIASLSHRTIVYKGMLTATQLEAFYPELRDPAMDTALALAHSRFSTNTFPSWERAQPFRYAMHNGEINTLRGNVHWMNARQATLASDLFGPDLPDLFPIMDPDGSDSAMFDNALELLVLGGYPLAHAIMMMIPEPWENGCAQTMSDARRAFYEYHSCLMEPWDGPAAVAFTDGTVVGAVLDRNGLRPSRYYLTEDGLVILASEVGVIDLPPHTIRRKGRLGPGQMLLVDTAAGRLITDAEAREGVAAAQPYRLWLDQHMVALADLPEPPVKTPQEQASLLQRQRAFGYTFEDLNLILGPLARDGVEPIGSMGNDTPLAVLSNKPQLLYSYFKQLFAQVTNPPIDAIREEIVIGQGVALGAEDNFLRPRPESCRLVKIPRPILTDQELARLRQVDRPGLKAATLSTRFPAEQGGPGLTRAMDALAAAADHAIQAGATILILSDRGIDAAHAAIPALLALAGVHHHLIRQGTRTRVGLVVESGEPREVHHFALLIGYGAGAVNPYLVFETLRDMLSSRLLTGVTFEQAEERYIKAVVKGVIKVMSKMGISTVDGYRGAQIFEALGLAQPLIDRYFTGTASRVGGVGIDVIAEEALMRHRHAFAQRNADTGTLETGGSYQWRSDGEHHTLNPLTVHKLQLACQTGNYAVFKEYSALINDQARTPVTLRSLLAFDFVPQPVPLAEVEPVETICRRFKTGAMSYGSISPEAHEALAIAMNRIGGKSNSGEGGEDPARYIPGPNGDSRSSAIKQVASGRFGVTSLYLNHAQEIQIKIAQGAKPGEGGQLPGRKVYPWIARVRLSTPGVGLISPPPHHDIYSIEDLAELIYDLKNANPRARISVKLVSEVGVGTIAAGVAKGHADVILVSGYDGGTGASPRTGIKHAGLPWELAVAETHQTLLVNNLRSRVVLETDGQLRTGRDVVIAALLGAEEFGFATAPLVTLGCTMMRVCHLDTCPFGVATQNPELRKNFRGDPASVVNFMRFIAQEVRELMAQLGFRSFDEMVGRSDRLTPRQPIDHWKARTLDFSRILARPEVPPSVGRYCQIAQNHELEQTLDYRVLIPLCEPALARGEPVRAILAIRNADRVIGTMLGSEVTRRYGAAGLPDDTIHLNFRGSAGQSFGAFVPRGITLELEGDANDYVGKGLSGGRIIVYPPASATFVPEENIIVGNVAFYGATSGQAYIRGMAGERFCVRNSGLHAVVEAIGDHGCEYMTGGRVVVLGPTGRNFAAGMSGGIAYVLDEAGDFAQRCNRDLVDLEGMDEEDAAAVREMIRQHVAHTGSARSQAILNRWDEMAPRFVKVIPRDYKRMLTMLHDLQRAGLSGDAAIMAAFEANKADSARVSGN